MSNMLQALCRVMDGCGCAGGEEERNDENNVFKDVVGNVMADVIEDNGMVTICTTTTSTDVDTGAKTGTDIVVSANTTTTPPMKSVQMMTMADIVTEQCREHDHDLLLPEVEQNDHEYLHECDIPQPLLSVVTKEPQSDSDMEIQVEQRDGHNQGPKHAAEKDDGDEEEKESESNKCDECKRWAELAECLEAVVLVMNESVRTMNDYIVKCALQMAALERTTKKQKPEKK